MKTVHVFSAVLAAMFVAACSNEELVSVSTGELTGEMIDAKNFTLTSTGYTTGDASSRVAYYPQYVTVNEDGNLVANPMLPTWEKNDAIGFSHIYSDQKIVTNYKFVTDGKTDENGFADFTTKNSTIFAGDYFVYYPFDDTYNDYNGIPYSISNIQNQNVEDQVTVGMDPTDGKNDTEELKKLATAGGHLSVFSISPRIDVPASIQQKDFTLSQYSSYIAFLIYPKNQTRTINVKRIEMVSAKGEPLSIPVGLRFTAEAGNDAAVPVVKETTDKMVLVFDNVDANKGAGGLEIAADGTKENASIGYMSMIPASYTKDSYKFVVYYTEAGILKKREIAGYKDLKFESNKPTFFNIELDANGATEVTDYEIYSETEFASAVSKSNAITNGEVTFTLMQDITLENKYTLSSAVPVNFVGGKTVKLAQGQSLTFSSDKKITFDNVISTEDGKTASVAVAKGEVSVKAFNSNTLSVTNRGTLTSENILTEGKGKTSNITNSKELIISNVDVAGNLTNNGTTATLTVKNASVTGSFTNSKVATLENVTVLGNLTNNSGSTLNVSGNNTFAYNATATPAAKTFTNSATINVTEGNTIVGNLTNNVTINLAKGLTNTVEFTAKGTSTLTNGSIVYVDANATYNAEGTVTGLKGDGTLSSSTMILEGKLTTNSTVTLAGNFKFCGTIENKESGYWTLDQYGVYSFDHAHQTKPAFVNNGYVNVKGVNAASSTVSMNKLSKELYQGNGILEWSDIKSFGNLNAIVKLGADCWATDLHVTKNSTNFADETFTTDVNWDKNVIVTVTGKINPTITTAKTINVNNLTVNFATDTNAKSLRFVNENGVTLPYVVNVKGNLALNNLVAASSTLDLTSAICKDLKVYNYKDAVFTIKNGYEIKYTNTYVTGGDYAGKISYPNNMPQLIK